VASFLGGPFRGLSKALGIQGGKGAPGDIDLGSLTPTLDLLGFARANSSRNYIMGVSDAHVAPGGITTLIDPWDLATFTESENWIALDADDEMVIYGAGGTTSELTDFNAAAIGVAWSLAQRANTDPATASIDIIFRSDATVGGMLDGDSTTLTTLAPDARDVMGFPYVMRQGQQLSYRSDSDTAGTVTIIYYVSFMVRRQWYGGGERALIPVRLAGVDACVLANRLKLDIALAVMVTELENWARGEFARKDFPGFWPGLSIVSAQRDWGAPGSLHKRCPAEAVDLRIGDMGKLPGEVPIWTWLGARWKQMGGRWGGDFRTDAIDRINREEMNHFDTGVGVEAPAFT